MLKSSRHLVRAACAAALLVGIGAGIAAAQPVIVEKAMPARSSRSSRSLPAPATTGCRAFGLAQQHMVLGQGPPYPRRRCGDAGAPIVEVVPAQAVSPPHVSIKVHHIFEGGHWFWHPGVWFRG